MTNGWTCTDAFEEEKGTFFCEKNDAAGNPIVDTVSNWAERVGEVAADDDGEGYVHGADNAYDGACPEGIVPGAVLGVYRKSLCDAYMVSNPTPSFEEMETW